MNLERIFNQPPVKPKSETPNPKPTIESKRFLKEPIIGRFVGSGSFCDVYEYSEDLYAHYLNKTDHVIKIYSKDLDSRKQLLKNLLGTRDYDILRAVIILNQDTRKQYGTSSILDELRKVIKDPQEQEVIEMQRERNEPINYLIAKKLQKRNDDLRIFFGDTLPNIITPTEVKIVPPGAKIPRPDIKTASSDKNTEPPNENTVPPNKKAEPSKQADKMKYTGDKIIDKIIESDASGLICEIQPKIPVDISLTKLVLLHEKKLKTNDSSSKEHTSSKLTKQEKITVDKLLSKLDFNDDKAMKLARQLELFIQKIEQLISEKNQYLDIFYGDNIMVDPDTGDIKVIDTNFLHDGNFQTNYWKKKYRSQLSLYKRLGACLALDLDQKSDKNFNEEP